MVRVLGHEARLCMSLIKGILSDYLLIAVLLSAFLLASDSLSILKLSEKLLSLG